MRKRASSTAGGAAPRKRRQQEATADGGDGREGTGGSTSTNGRRRTTTRARKTAGKSRQRQQRQQRQPRQRKSARRGPGNGVDVAFVYVLCDCDRRCTYVGATLDPDRRLRQHNGELSGGARRTSRGRPWQTLVRLRVPPPPSELAGAPGETVIRPEPQLLQTQTASCVDGDSRGGGEEENAGDDGDSGGGGEEENAGDDDATRSLACGEAWRRALRLEWWIKHQGPRGGKGAVTRRVRAVETVLAREEFRDIERVEWPSPPPSSPCVPGV